MNELQEFFENTANQTPIEIALQVDEDGTVSTRNLYEFLELLPKNFSEWCKRNILENEFAAKNEDYCEVLFEKGFASPSGGTYKRTMVDYKLSVSFAKKLCMLQRTERGEEARNYFLKVEDKLKQVALATKGDTQIAFMEAALMKIKDHETKIEAQEKRIAIAEKHSTHVELIATENATELTELKRKLEKTNFILPETTEQLDGLFLAPVTLYTTSAIGKAFSISARTINRYLFKQGVQTPEKRGWRLTAKYENCNYVYQKIGYFRVVGGEKEEHLITYWTATGKDFVCAILLKSGLKQKSQVKPYDRHAKKKTRTKKYQATQARDMQEKGGVAL